MLLVKNLLRRAEQGFLKYLNLILFQVVPVGPGTHFHLELH